MAASLTDYFKRIIVSAFILVIAIYLSAIYLIAVYRNVGCPAFKHFIKPRLRAYEKTISDKTS